MKILPALISRVTLVLWILEFEVTKRVLAAILLPLISVGGDRNFLRKYFSIPPLFATDTKYQSFWELVSLNLKASAGIVRAVGNGRWRAFKPGLLSALRG